MCGPVGRAADSPMDGWRMTARAAKPPFGLYVIWHPGCLKGETIATRLYRHFGTDRCHNLASGAGVPVPFRRANAPNSDAPLRIDWDGTDAAAVVVLADGALVRDSSWVRYVSELIDEARSRGLCSRVIPVVMEAGALDICQGIQALRWDRWAEGDEGREQRLIRDLTQEFIRMLRYGLERQHPGATDDLGNYMRNVNVFLSHSTHDQYGACVARAIRDWLHDHTTVSSFLAPRDIPAGMPFDTVISESIQDSAMAVIYTDSYSSREWCRREVVEAKRRGVPMLVVDCLQAGDERSFPYLGNVPVVRMDPAGRDMIPAAAGRLLDEVFKYYHWRRSVEILGGPSPQVIFMARPPELASLAALPGRAGGGTRLVVYPDPPLGALELDLLSSAGSGLRLLSLTQWQAEAGP